MTEVTLKTGDGETIFEGSSEDFTAAVDKIAGTGHNKRNRVGGINAEQLKGIIARVENMEEAKAAIAADIKDIFAEARVNGYDCKAIKQILKIRKLDASEREEQESILDVYLHALNMLPQTEMDFEQEE